MVCIEKTPLPFRVFLFSEGDYVCYGDNYFDNLPLIWTSFPSPLPMLSPSLRPLPAWSLSVQPGVYSVPNMLSSDSNIPDITVKYCS